MSSHTSPYMRTRETVTVPKKLANENESLGAVRLSGAQSHRSEACCGMVHYVAIYVPFQRFRSSKRIEKKPARRELGLFRGR